MSLHIRAELSEQTLIDLLGQLLPATIDLDPLGADPGRRWIRLERPSFVDFVQDRGLRVRTSATLQWTTLGIAVPITLREADVSITPVVASDERGPKLVFRPSLERADFKLLPDFVDQAITDRINAALAAQGELVGWHFGESLARRVPMPSNLSPVDAMELGGAALRVHVRDRSLVIEAEVALAFTRRRPDAPVALGGGAPPPAGPRG
jgi:hypothetical protein